MHFLHIWLSKCLWILAQMTGTVWAKSRRVPWSWTNVNVVLVGKWDCYFLSYWPVDIMKWIMLIRLSMKIICTVCRCACRHVCVCAVCLCHLDRCIILIILDEACWCCCLFYVCNIIFIYTTLQDTFLDVKTWWPKNVNVNLRLPWFVNIEKFRFLLWCWLTL